MPLAVDWSSILFNVVLPAVVGGLGGTVVSALLSRRLEESRRRHAFLEQQLREFYSPLLGLRAEVRAKSELRARIDRVAHAEWQGLLERVEGGGPEAIEKLRHERGEAFIDRMIEYDNTQFKEHLLPAYGAMVKVFRENLWLADEATRTHFATLVEYVELWDRWLAGAVPPEVMEHVDRGEAALHPFYDRIERTHDALRKKLSEGKG